MPSYPAADTGGRETPGRFQRRSADGGDLLIDALRRIARAADSLCIALVMLDGLDCGNGERVQKQLKLYPAYGFTPLPSHPLRLLPSLATVRALLAE